jgi:hypothetical protein
MLDSIIAFPDVLITNTDASCGVEIDERHTNGKTARCYETQYISNTAQRRMRMSAGHHRFIHGLIIS